MVQRELVIISESLKLEVSKPPYLHPPIHFEVTIYISSATFQNISG